MAQLSQDRSTQASVSAGVMDTLKTNLVVATDGPPYSYLRINGNHASLYLPLDVRDDLGYKIALPSGHVQNSCASAWNAVFDLSDDDLRSAHRGRPSLDGSIHTAICEAIGSYWAGMTKEDLQIPVKPLKLSAPKSSAFGDKLLRTMIDSQGILVLPFTVMGTTYSPVNDDESAALERHDLVVDTEHSCKPVFDPFNYEAAPAISYNLPSSLHYPSTLMIHDRKRVELTPTLRKNFEAKLSSLLNDDPSEEMKEDLRYMGYFGEIPARLKEKVRQCADEWLTKADIECTQAREFPSHGVSNPIHCKFSVPQPLTDSNVGEKARIWAKYKLESGHDGNKLDQSDPVDMDTYRVINEMTSNAVSRLSDYRPQHTPLDKWSEGLLDLAKQATGPLDFIDGAIMNRETNLSEKITWKIDLEAPTWTPSHGGDLIMTTTMGTESDPKYLSQKSTYTVSSEGLVLKHSEEISCAGDEAPNS